MIFIFVLIISLFTLSLFRVSAYELIIRISQHAHSFCIQQIPSKSVAQPELKALVCAENFSTLQQSETYITSGLIHLFVVSGAHLILIERIFTLLTRQKPGLRFLLLFILVSYAFLCGLTPPVIRCLMAFSLNFYLLQKNIKWPAHNKVFFIGLITLSFNFNWVSSLSLQLSWIAALLVSLGEDLFKNKHPLFKQSLFYFALLPTIIYFQVPDPTVILINLFLAPVLEFFLFPLALAVWFIPALHVVFDFAVHRFNSFLVMTEIPYRAQLHTLPESIHQFNWFLILVLHFYFHLSYVRKWRGQT